MLDPDELLTTAGASALVNTDAAVLLDVGAGFVTEAAFKM